MQDPTSTSIVTVPVNKFTDAGFASVADTLSVEEPLEIAVAFGPVASRETRTISITMRTPGNDLDLATGFLFTEGIIASVDDIVDGAHKIKHCASEKENSICIELAEGVTPKLAQADRNFYTTSSCGVCGKSSIQSIRTVSAFAKQSRPAVAITSRLICQLPAKLRAAQNDFIKTGSLHASALFDAKGELLLLREDVGRHNALDKLIGRALRNNLLPLEEHILLLSGRISFELVQKAVMAGINTIAAIGAPSSLAVELAREFDITLIGFLKEDRFNIYHQATSLQCSTPYENQD